MFFLIIHCIFSFDHTIKNILLGKWYVNSSEIFFDDQLKINHTYNLQFLEHEPNSLIGDLFEYHNSSQTELITTIKLDFTDLITIVWTGSLRYFYKLIKIQFIRSHYHSFYAQGKFIDGTGSYVCSIYSSTRVDFTLYEKEKVTFFSMEKNTENAPFLWMSKYFYFLPVTVFLIIIVFLSQENEQPTKSNKVKTE